MRKIAMIAIVTLLALSPEGLWAYEMRDTVAVSGQKTEMAGDSLPGKEGMSFMERFKEYFKDSNKDFGAKRFNFNFIGGPHYASDTKFGIGLVGAGLYRMRGCGTEMQPSNVSLFGDVSTVGYYLLGLRGNNLFPDDRYRLNYSIYFYSFPTYYWGMGYEECSENGNKTKMKRFQAQMKAEFLFRIVGKLYVGPMVVWDYVQGSGIEGKESLFDGMDMTTRNYGAGLSLVLDTRDYITDASQGVSLKVNQVFRPKAVWNRYAFSTTEVQFTCYRRAWRGAVVAMGVGGVFNYGDPSWAMMAKMGDSYWMRGYYEGRYRDKDKLEAQVELRQHVWRRSGIAEWCGAGTIFHSKASLKHIMPNYGIGYRWEFKRHMNVRLDWGFGKSGENSFIFNINEAF